MWGTQGRRREDPPSRIFGLGKRRRLADLKFGHYTRKSGRRQLHEEGLRSLGGGGGVRLGGGGGGVLELELGAELFGALAGGAVWVEGDVRVEVGEEGGVVFLGEVDVGEKAVDDGDTGSEKAGLFGGVEGVWILLFEEEDAAEFVVADPKILILHESLAN
jgi:hypothetical protein